MSFNDGFSIKGIPEPAGPVSGNVLVYDGTDWVAGDVSGSGGGTPGGTDQTVQFNKAGTFSGSTQLIYDYNTNILSGTISQFTGMSSSYIVLSSSTEPDQTAGTIFYDNTNGLMRQWTEVTGVDLHLGQQLAVRVKNESGLTLAKGKVVHITGSTNSDTPLVTTASYESDSLSADTLGVLMSQLDPNETGYALLYGVLTGIDLSTYASGDMLYLSSSGDFSKDVPVSPLHEVRIGQVTRATNNGAAFIRIQNGYEIEELHDVLISGRQNGDLLSWDSNALVWKNTKILSGSYEVSGGVQVTGSLLVNGSIRGDIDVSGNITGAGYTLTDSDYAKTLLFSSSTSQSITCSAGLPNGFNVTAVQMGAGKLIFSGSSGVTLRNRFLHTGSAGQFAAVSVVVLSSNQYLLVGDTA